MRLPLVIQRLLPRTQLLHGKSTLSKLELIVVVGRFRFWLLLAMALSCHVIPDHNPGDDVMRFNMRLEERCFCLHGHICEEMSNIETIKNCATSNPSWTRVLFWKFWLSPLTKWDAARFLNLAVQPSLRDPPSDSVDFASSEQAHAFFPMYPAVVAKCAQLLYQVLPAILLPPTFEALVSLSGFLVNLVCLIIATWSLYDLTIHLLAPSSLNEDQKHEIAIASCLVYGIWNPASIFFATNYSESLFSACTLLGHALFQRRQVWSCTVAIGIWMAGSYTRSNGSLQILWLIQFALGNWARWCIGKTNLHSVLVQTLMLAVGILCVALPVKYHDWQGYHRHCSSSSKPEWCLPDGGTVLSFSLYGWTQREHWNVGFFRYYEWKQIPNFLLAAPILGLSLCGVYQWIIFSLLTDFGKGKVPAARLVLMDWPVHALSEAVGSETKIPTVQSVEEILVHNPLLLGHFAVLAILTLVGILIAHVQISTRLISSSCPAIVWYLTYCMIQEKHPQLRVVILCYSVLYILLGVILHVNFLPWT